MKKEVRHCGQTGVREQIRVPFVAVDALTLGG
jgi:hypothetical protein